jgi:hypothetical protein
MYFELIGRIRQVETIAAAHSIRDRARLRRLYGRDGGASARGSRRFVSQMDSYAKPKSIGTRRLELVEEN